MTDFQDYMNTHKIYPDNISRRIDIAPGFDSYRDTATDGKPHPDNGVPVIKESLTTKVLRDEDGEIVPFAKQCVACGAEMAEENPSQTCWVCKDILKPIPCAWCNPEHHLLRFNVSWWVRASTGKRKWMSVTQQNKAHYCPMCGRKLEAEK